MKTKTKWMIVAGAAFAVLIFFTIYQPKVISTAFSPLVVGCVLAYIVNLITRVLEKWYFPHAKNKFLVATRTPVCIITAVIILLAAVALVAWLVVPQLVECINLLIKKIPTAYTTSVTWLKENEILSDEVLKKMSELKWEDVQNGFIGTITSGIGSVVNATFSMVATVSGAFLTAFIGTIFAVYLLVNKKKLARQANQLIDRFLSEKNGERFRYGVRIIDESFRKYIIGQCTEAVILGVLCGLGMWAIRLPYPAMIGALIAFTSLIPIAGAYIGGAIGAFMIFTEDPIKALIFIIYLVILQQLEGNLIYPKVVGESVGLPAMWVLAAVTIGGGLMGIPGMLLSVPVASAIYRILREQVNRGKPEKRALT